MKVCDTQNKRKISDSIHILMAGEKTLKTCDFRGFMKLLKHKFTLCTHMLYENRSGSKSQSMLFLLLFQKTPTHIIKYFIIIQRQWRNVLWDRECTCMAEEGKYTLHKHISLMMEIHIYLSDVESCNLNIKKKLCALT